MENYKDKKEFGEELINVPATDHPDEFQNIAHNAIKLPMKPMKGFSEGTKDVLGLKKKQKLKKAL